MVSHSRWQRGIEVSLWDDIAPNSVANFLTYVDDDHYSNLIFHRVIEGFMIQGGGYDATMRQRNTRAPIKNEARAEVSNDRGTIALARTSDVDSATAQFFINLVDNNFLNHRDTTPHGYGYCVFGKVVSGMDVVDAIGAVATGIKGGVRDVPDTPVVIKEIRRSP